LAERRCRRLVSALETAGCMLRQILRWCAENIQEAALTVPASQTGNRTECALLGLVRGLGRDYDKLRVVVKR